MPMKQFLLILFLSCLHFSAFANEEDNSFFDNADSFFRKHVWDGKVYYHQVKKNTQQLDSLVKQIAKFEIDKKNNNRSKSFYINAYNILVIKNVINHYPVLSVKEINGFFDNYKFNVAGKKLSLNQIQFNALIKIDKDVRMLFSLSNGSINSSAIYNAALSNNRQLNINLENRMRAFANDASNINVNDENKTVIISQLFKWHEAAIAKKFPTVLDFINKYRRIRVPVDYSILYADYDWTLNDMNEKTVSEFAPLNSTERISINYISLTYHNHDELKLIDTGLVLKSHTDLNTKINHNEKLFDEELGFRNESRFIESKTYEFRITGKFYTQKDYYNKKMLRVSSDYRTTYNDVSVQGTYSFSRRLQGGASYHSQKSYNDNFPAKAIDFFSASPDKKFHSSELELFIKRKWHEKKYRFSTLAYLTLPLVNKRLNDKIATGNKYYDVGFIVNYDGYPASFMRMILSAEFLTHYSIAREIITLELNPSSRFIFTIYRSKPVSITAMMDLLFIINENKTIPFSTIESIAVRKRILYNLDCNLVYQYYVLGKSTGAGHALKMELRYAFQ